MTSSPISVSMSEQSDEEDLDNLDKPLSPGAARALQDERYRLRINKIKKTLGRDPTEFELLALSVFPLPLTADSHLTNQDGVNIKCCTKAFQLLFNCEVNDDVNGLHEAGSLFRVLVEEPSPLKDHSTMSSAPPISHQYGLRDYAYDTSGSSNDPFVNVQPTIAADNATYGLAAAAHDRRHSMGRNPHQSTCTQYPPSVVNPEALNPPETQFMAEHPRLSYGNGSGVANYMSPSSGKRAFSSSYLNSYTTVASAFNLIPSPKRRGGLAGPNNHKVVEKTGQAAIEYLESLKREVVGRSAKRATTSAIAQDQNIVSGTSKLAVPDDPQDYSKYYRYLAEKHNIKGSQTPNGGDAGSKVYVSPYKPVNAPASSDQQQDSQLTSVSASNPQTSASIAFPDDQDMRRGQSDQHKNLPQQQASLSNLPTYNATEEKVRRRAKVIRDLQMGQIKIMRLGRANTSSTIHQGLVGPPASSISNPYMPNQHTQGNTHPITLQNTSVSQNPYAGHSNLELSRRMAEEHAKDSHHLLPPGLSPTTVGHAAAINDALSTSSMLPDDSSQHLGLNAFVDRSSDMAPVQSFDPNTDSESFTNGASLQPHSAQYTRDDAQENASNPIHTSTVPHTTVSTVPQARPRTDISKILPQFRQEYQVYEENLMNGIQTLTNLPSWLVLRAKKKAGLLPPELRGDDSESEDDCLELPPKPPAYQRIIATAETGPLPNINQPYTGSPSSLPPYFAAHYVLNQMEMPPVPVTTPTKKTTASKKKTPASKTKKTPTPRKSRAKKTPQSNDWAITPPAIIPRPPNFDFSSPTNGYLANNSTLENMIAGDFTQFFGSAEEEAKWKQDAVAQAMAEKDAPSKRQLKMVERERKRLEKEMKAKK